MVATSHYYKKQNLNPNPAVPNKFLESSTYIDHDHPSIRQLATTLADGSADPLSIAERCFVFVRDQIRHSVDFRCNPITCKASDVLLHGTGYCYAKSHLLAALLRANAIPAALCYQRLTVGNDGAPHCLHGLNAVYLPQFGWYRIDARGNKVGVDAHFTPPQERLAFAIRPPEEGDLPGLYAVPLAEVVAALVPPRTWDQVLADLPDRAITL